MHQIFSLQFVNHTYSVLEISKAQSLVATTNFRFQNVKPKETCEVQIYE